MLIIGVEGWLLIWIRSVFLFIFWVLFLLYWVLLFVALLLRRIHWCRLIVLSVAILLGNHIVFIAVVIFWNVFRDISSIFNFVLCLIFGLDWSLVETWIILFWGLLFFYYFCRIDLLDIFFWWLFLSLQTFVLLDYFLTLFA